MIDGCLAMISTRKTGSVSCALMAAGRETEWRRWAEGRGIETAYRSFPTLEAAIAGFDQEHGPRVLSITQESAGR